MPRSPFDLNRDGRWSTSERSFAWMAGQELGRGDDRRVGCGRLGVPLVALLAVAPCLAGCLS